MQLNKIRKKIDEIDAELMLLINQRMELALRTRRYKTLTTDEQRELDVLEASRSRSFNLIEPDFAENIQALIIKQSKSVQEKHPRLAGFQGEHGAYSEVAIRSFEDALVPMPCREFVDVFEAVERGELDIGVVPVENNIAGAIPQVTDLLINSSLHIVGEVLVPIHHCLLAKRDADYRNLRVVYSHPAALAQCQQFLDRNALDAKPYFDTAGAAKMLMSESLEATAVIASKLCAELYNLEVIKENIENETSSRTRFVILSKEALTEGNKCSIVFSTQHSAGSLSSVLKTLSDNNINMTRIESRPMNNKPDEYAFLVDIQGGAQEERISEALRQIEEQSGYFKLLGCYLEAE